MGLLCKQFSDHDLMSWNLLVNTVSVCLWDCRKVVFEILRSFWGLCKGTDIPKGLSLAPWSRPCIQENWSLSQLVSCLQFCCWMHHSTHISLLLTFRKIMWQGRDLLKAWLRPFSLDCICCLQVKWFPWRRIFHLVSLWDIISYKASLLKIYQIWLFNPTTGSHIPSWNSPSVIITYYSSSRCDCSCDGSLDCNKVHNAHEVYRRLVFWNW